MPAKKKAQEPATVEGFETFDYEGTTMFRCERCTAPVTFQSVPDAEAHGAWHAAQDKLAAERDAANLAPKQETTEVPDDDAG